MPGRGQGVTPEEPAAENLHGGIREGGGLGDSPGLLYSECSVHELAGLSFACLGSRAAGLDLLKGLSAAREFGDDGFDGSRPHKRSGFLVPGDQKIVNGCNQVLQAQEGVAADSLAG